VARDVLSLHRSFRNFLTEHGMMNSAVTQPAVPDALPERRGEQRFPLHLPVLITRIDAVSADQSSVTEDISARGALFEFKNTLPEGTVVELLLTLPADITLSEDIHVRCRARVVRIVELSQTSRQIAVLIEKYDFTRYPRS
jgi:hypothetical protein